MKIQNQAGVRGSKIKSFLCFTAAVCVLLCGCNSDSEDSYSSVTELLEDKIENDARQRIEIAEQSMNVETETQEQTLERLTPIESLLSEKEQDETEVSEEKTSEAEEYTETADEVPETEPQNKIAETESVTYNETVQEETEIIKNPQHKPVG